MKYIGLILLSALAIPVLAQESPGFVNSTSKGPNERNSKNHIILTNDPGAHEFQVWGGYSFNSFNSIWGKTPDVQLEILGLRYNRKFLELIANTVEYTIGFTLYANYEYPEFTEEHNRNSISGFGLAPLGFQFNFNNKHNVQPFLKTSGGFIYLEEPFPDNRGIKFNFTLELGGGLEFMLGEHSSLSLGYKYHHLSNGEMGHVNPGIDSNLFYAGITIF